MDRGVRLAASSCRVVSCRVVSWERGDDGELDLNATQKGKRDEG